jgi:hypothetical protein
MSYLFIAMDDDKVAHLVFCADETAVRSAVKDAMFFHEGRELSKEHQDQLDGCVEELLDSGALVFEGDPPLYLFKVLPNPVSTQGWLHRLDMEKNDAWMAGYNAGLKRAPKS